MFVKIPQFPKEISYEDWISVRDAILVDCDTILEAYKDVNEEPVYGSKANDATHKSNAMYMKNELSDVIDSDMSRYKSPMGIWDWVKILLREDFFLKETTFRFPNAKEKWLEVYERLELNIQIK